MTETDLKPVPKTEWFDFYMKRINSSYQEYFNRRYKPLLDIILEQKVFAVREEGIGIGSVAKALQALTVDEMYIYGFDQCNKMLELCQENNPWISVYRDDILREGKKLCSTFYPEPDLVVTHGVLEHFQDDQIQEILSRYRRKKIPNIHYVPTSGYEMPSFGDERLLEPDYWLSKFKPADHLLFNSEKDLLLINL